MKKGTNRFKEELMIGFMVADILMFGFGIFLFMQGFHYMDQSQNIMRVASWGNLDVSTLVDCGLSLKGYICAPLEQVYIDGAFRVMAGMFIVGFAGILIGIHTTGLVTRR